MPQTIRLNIRLPRKTREALDKAAEAGGYASAAQLARCVRVRFVSHSAELAAMADELTAWIDDTVAATDSVGERIRINNRQ